MLGTVARRDRGRGRERLREGQKSHSSPRMTVNSGDSCGRE